MVKGCSVCGQSDGFRYSAVIFSSASLLTYLFLYLWASSLPKCWFHSLLRNLDLMHLFGAQTETISRSCFTDHLIAVRFFAVVNQVLGLARVSATPLAEVSFEWRCNGS